MDRSVNVSPRLVKISSGVLLLQRRFLRCLLSAIRQTWGTHESLTTTADIGMSASQSAIFTFRVIHKTRVLVIGIIGIPITSVCNNRSIP